MVGSVDGGVDAAWGLLFFFLLLMLVGLPILDVIAGLATGLVCGLSFNNLRLWRGVGIGFPVGLGYGVMRLLLSDGTSAEQFAMAVAAILVVPSVTVLACWFTNRRTSQL